MLSHRSSVVQTAHRSTSWGRTRVPVAASTSISKEPRKLKQRFTAHPISYRKNHTLKVAAHAGERRSQIYPKPFDALALDVILGLSEVDGFNACLVLTDLLPKAVKRRPTKNTATAKDIADLVLQAVILQGFLPAVIISDRDTKYVAAVWKASTSKMGIRMLKSRGYTEPSEREILHNKLLLEMGCYMKHKQRPARPPT